MADTIAGTGLTVQQWDDKFFTEYFQENRFNSEMGTSENSIIQVKQDLTKKKGDSITFALVNRLTGAGVTDANVLEGNEEALDTRSFQLTINQRRHAVRSSAWDEQISAISLRNAGRVAMMDWVQEDTRDRIILALGSINGVNYASASAGQRNTWVVDNEDRVLMGALKSNFNSTHLTALANVDNTADKLTSAAASLMKRIALSASPKIRPVRSASSGRRYYTMYCPSLVFRDLLADSTITQAQRDVGLRMQNEKLFNGGDIEWDGIIFKEIDDIAVLSGAGAGSIDISPVYLCGAQAVGYGIAKRWSSVTETFDYDDKHGLAMREMGNFAKLTFGTGSGDTDDLKDHGMVTGFFASVADA